LRDRLSIDQFHYKIGPSRVGGAGVEDARDARMIKHRERVPLGLEPRQHVAAVHAGFDQLQSNIAMDGISLLGQVNIAEASLTDPPQDRVPANTRAGWEFKRGVAW